ncbi:hypothetical protein KORDIASMS9_03075 [Kordia sp. SMS9]|uniref:hypothetical protein n=1 Tax=Kordia sp. SMS9 TaxID=2282170 RepID=UPI000E0D24AC|nr:hypothetical protein [Kordia sp. SMS9]AXG70828.1 hypothetical protein KORDIASMS9_03075 [Kordia sp. SMS9]
MKKRELKSLALNKKSVSNLDNLVKGGIHEPIDSLVKLCADTGCVGPIKQTCGIINCDLQSNIACEA